MGTLWEYGASNSIATILISTLTRGVQIFTITWVFGILQRPPPNIHPTVFRMSEMLVTKSSLRSPKVCLGVLLTLQFILTATPVEERGWDGCAATAVDAVKGPAKAFDPLNTVLKSISVLHAKYQVYFYALSKDLP